jgi:hypothetical protein
MGAGLHSGGTTTPGVRDRRKCGCGHMAAARAAGDGVGSGTHSTQESLMKDETQLQGTFERHHVGRFSEGIEQLADTPEKRRIGSFADGYDLASRRRQGWTNPRRIA